MSLVIQLITADQLLVIQCGVIYHHTDVAVEGNGNNNGNNNTEGIFGNGNGNNNTGKSTTMYCLINTVQQVKLPPQKMLANVEKSLYSFIGEVNSSFD